MMNYLNEDNCNPDDIVLDAADESAIFLAALQDTCTAEEYNDLVMENLTELELYGLIESAEVVTEGLKIIKHKVTKQENLNREQAKAAFRLARKADDSEMKKYNKHRKLMIESREKIFKKYGAKAKSEARRVIQGAKRKASSMPSTSTTGMSITEKMDKKINEINKQ